MGPDGMPFFDSDPFSGSGAVTASMVVAPAPRPLVPAPMQVASTPIDMTTRVDVPWAPGVGSQTAVDADFRFEPDGSPPEPDEESPPEPDEEPFDEELPETPDSAPPAAPLNPYFAADAAERAVHDASSAYDSAPVDIVPIEPDPFYYDDLYYPDEPFIDEPAFDEDDEFYVSK